MAEASGRHEKVELGLQQHPKWVNKVIEVYEMCLVRHSLMCVGPSGVGKSRIVETLQKAQYKSHILEIENQGLNSDLKRKAAQLEELEALTMVLQSGLLGPAGDLAQEGREFKRPKRIQEIQSCVAAQ